MDLLKSIAIAASGLRAQSGRMQVISENIANADSTPTQTGGDPYRRQIATFQSEMDRELGAKVSGDDVRFAAENRLGSWHREPSHCVLFEVGGEVFRPVARLLQIAGPQKVPPQMSP